MSECSVSDPDTRLVSRTLLIRNQRGLHARASAKFVQCAQSFDAKVTVARDGQTVDGSSIMDLMMLAALPGSSIDVAAVGPEAQEALDALETLVEDKFGEGE